MNMETGIFTAPTTGRYYFSFTARSDAANDNNNVQLRVNGRTIGIAHAPTSDYNLPISATLNLRKGDTVYMFLDTGSLADKNQAYTHFSGVLLEEDLIL
jgi:hypothetical protein